jgi:hypothetical protein
MPDALYRVTLARTATSEQRPVRVTVWVLPD